MSKKTVVTTIGDLVEFQRGYDLPKEKFVQGDIPVISSNGILGYHNEARVKAPGITIGRSGTVGLPHYIDKDFFPHNTALFIKDFKGNNSKYIFYLLQTLNLNERKSGSGVPTMNRNHLHPLKIKAHLDIDFQERIASVLSSLDDKIELNNQINAELEAMAKTLYDYWFVQFDFPDANGKPYKSSGGKMVYNEDLKREIPEGWENTVVGNIAELVRGVSYSKEEIEDNLTNANIKILRATNISGNVIDLNNPIIIPQRLVTEKQILNKYDILLTMSSGSIEHIGKNGFFYFDENVSFGAFCAKLVPVELFKYYLYQFMQSPYLNVLIKNECLGTNINNLNSSMVKGFKLVKPKKEVLDKFNNIVDLLFHKIEINVIQNQYLASLRDWLLPMLMNGQVGFKEEYQEEVQTINMAAEAEVEYKLPTQQEQRFELWLSSQGLAARGEIDKVTLREIFNVMDGEEYGK